MFWPGNFGKLGSTGFTALAAVVFATSLAEGGFGNAPMGALVLGATANFGKLAISVFGSTIGLASALGGNAAGLAGGVTGAGNSAGGRVSFTTAGFASFFTTGAAAGSGSFAGGATTSGAGNAGSGNGFVGSGDGAVPMAGNGGNAGGIFSVAGNSFTASFFGEGATWEAAGGAAGTTVGTGGSDDSTGALVIFFSSLRIPCFSGSVGKVFSSRFVTDGGNAGGGGGAVSGTGTNIGEAEIGGADAGCDNAFSNSDLLCFGSLFFAGAGLLTTTGFVSFAAGFSFTGLMFDGTASASGDGNAGIAGAVALGAFAEGSTAAGSGGKSPGRGCNCWAVLGFASAFTAGNCVAGTTVGKGAFCQFVGFAGLAGAGAGEGGTTGAAGCGAGANVGNGAGIGAATGSFTAGAGAGAGGGGTTGAGAGLGAATVAFTTGAGAGGAIGCGAGIGAGITGCGAAAGAAGFTLLPRLPRVLVFGVCCASGSAAGSEAAGSGRTKGCAGTSGRFSIGTARSTTGGATGAGAGATGAPPCRPRNASRLISTLGGVADACASAGAAPSPQAMQHTLASSAARKAVTG